MKITSYKVKLTAFYPAEAFNLGDVQQAHADFSELQQWLNERGFADVEFTAKPGSKRVSAAAADNTKGAASQAAAAAEPAPHPLDPPAFLDRRG